MLTTLKNILNIAKARKIAIGSFNTPNLESLYAVIKAAEELNEPVIIMHAQVHEEMGLCKMEDIAPIMLFMADKAKVPVCVHLDHGTDLDYVKKGLDLGFTSVMYDASELDLSLNTANTAFITELAIKYGASVEAEVGSMGSREGVGAGESIYTDPDLARDFVEETGVDALACAFGTAHGLYLKKPQLDFDRLAEINSKISVPIVMHGGSGVSHEDYITAINKGVRKINYYSYMAKAGAQGILSAAETTFFHDIIAYGQKAMMEDVKTAIKVFSGK